MIPETDPWLGGSAQGITHATVRLLSEYMFRGGHRIYEKTFQELGTKLQKKGAKLKKIVTKLT